MTGTAHVSPWTPSFAVLSLRHSVVSMRREPYTEVHVLSTGLAHSTQQSQILRSVLYIFGTAFSYSQIYCILLIKYFVYTLVFQTYLNGKMGQGIRLNSSVVSALSILIIFIQ